MSELVSISPQEAVLLGAEKLTTFGQFFFPRTFRRASPAFHDEIGTRLYADIRYLLVLVFRDGAKTSLLRVFTAQRIAYSISRTILFVSASQEHSKITIRWLKRAVERNAYFRDTFKLSPGSKWTDEWIEIINGVTGETINVLAAGITGQIRGFNLDDFRPDLIVADDILTDELTRTKEQREKTSDLFYGALYNSLADATEFPHAKIVLLQTPFHEQDLAMQASNDPSWNPMVFGILDAKGESIWPDRFPTAAVVAERDNAFLRGRKKIWMREKACRIVKTTDKALNSDLLKYWTEVPSGLIRFLAIDPASSDKKKADQNVVATIGIKGSNVYVLKYDATQGTMPDQCAEYFFEHRRMFAPILKGGVEGVAYQRTLKWYLEREMRERRLFLPLEHIDDRRSKPDKILQHLPSLLAYGNLYIHPSMLAFIQQMDDYDPQDSDADDDILDAVSMAIRLAGPMLHMPYDTIEGNAREITDESDYPLLQYNGGCP